MGFDVNFNQKPVIQSAQHAHDGGAGNLGYFEGGGSNKDHKKDKSIFEEESDSFNKSSEHNDIQDDFSISNFIARIILAIKDWLSKLLH